MAGKSAWTWFPKAAARRLHEEYDAFKPSRHLMLHRNIDKAKEATISSCIVTAPHFVILRRPPAGVTLHVHKRERRMA